MIVTEHVIITHASVRVTITDTTTAVSMITVIVAAVRATGHTGQEGARTIGMIIIIQGMMIGFIFRRRGIIIGINCYHLPLLIIIQIAAAASRGKPVLANIIKI